MTLDRAAMGSHVGVAKLLLECGADMSIPRKIKRSKYDGKTAEIRPPLAVAALHGHVDIVELLLANGADPLWESSERSWLEEGKIRRKYRSRRRVEGGLWQYERTWTALHYAIENGYEKIVEILLKAGADVKDKNLPLAWAIIAGETAIVEILLDHGAEIETGLWGERMLSLASRCGNDEAVELLTEKGANIEARDGNGRSPLSLAATETVAKILLEAGADVNSADNRGCTPLCWTKDIAVVQLLLEAKADVNSARRSGRTPLIVAVKQNSLRKAKLLLEHRAEVDAKDFKSRTPLIIAARKKDRSRVMIRLLLDHSASLEVEDTNGLTALSWAAWKARHSGSVEILLEHGASPAAFVGYMPYRDRRRAWSLFDRYSDSGSTGGSGSGKEESSEPESDYGGDSDGWYY
jgi:ankyrin repeat protein